jgi:hypothetical protein
MNFPVMFFIIIHNYNYEKKIMLSFPDITSYLGISEKKPERGFNGPNINRSPAGHEGGW